MWRKTLVLYQLLMTGHFLWTQELHTFDGVVTAQDCSLDCIRRGGPGCEYCRITRADAEKILGFHSIYAFGSCVPWPCFALLGEDNPELCQHYVQAPSDVTVEFIPDQNPTSDIVVVTWRPSQYGIAFLRGFQVSIQELGGFSVACQLFLFQRNLSLSVSHAQKVYKSDPFPNLALGVQYVVTVMALPVPEAWDNFHSKKNFSTHSCAEKNGIEQCKKDWYPKHVEVKQQGVDIIVTFNLAPPDLGIKGYFSMCYGKDKTNYSGIIPNTAKNTTHHSYHLHGLQEGINYTCEIAADEVDAVRKMFRVRVLTMEQEAALHHTTHPSLALMLTLGLAFTVILVVLLASLIWRTQKLKKPYTKPDISEQHEDEVSNKEDVMSLQSSRVTPPRLLICYSRHDGPAHITAVMKLGAFLQQHMATQVYLDLWDSLRVAEEGTLAWHCQRLRENDFVLVVCSRGLNRRPAPPRPHADSSEEETPGWESNTSSCAAVIALIGEEVCRTKARGQDLSKYMAAIFEYSEETDIPAELSLVSHYTLPRDLPPLFSHVHKVPLHKPGGYLKVEHISEQGYAKLPAGMALQRAVCEAATALAEQEGEAQADMMAL